MGVSVYVYMSMVVSWPWVCVIYIYIYIYIYILFGPVKPELGVIPSGQENHSKTEHLNFPGRELNVINITEQYFKKKNKNKDRLLQDYKFMK